jgi:hypothetical protein
MYMVPYICLCKPYTYKTSHTLSYISKYRIPYTYKTSHTLSYVNKYRVPYISIRQVTHCLCKTVCDLSYRCIWYPIFVYVRQCVTCLVCIWYPIFTYVRQCVTCLVCIWYPIFAYTSIRQVTHCLT